MRNFLASLAILAVSGCGLLDSRAVPPGYFDLALVRKDVTAAVRDYVRRTSTERIDPDEVHGASAFTDMEWGFQIVAGQKHRGTPVWNAMRRYSVDERTGKVKGSLGEWLPVPDTMSVQPTLTEAEARVRALAFLVEVPPDYVSAEAFLYVARIDVGHSIRLIWVVPYKTMADQTVYDSLLIDAHTGGVIVEV